MSPFLTVTLSVSVTKILTHPSIIKAVMFVGSLSFICNFFFIPTSATLVQVFFTYTWLVAWFLKSRPLLYPAQLPKKQLFAPLSLWKKTLLAPLLHKEWNPDSSVLHCLVPAKPPIRFSPTILHELFHSIQTSLTLISEYIISISIHFLVLLSSYFLNT